MVTTHSVVFDGVRVAPLDGLRQPMLLESAAEIVPGDWLRDLGTLREVESVETLPGDGVRGATIILHFAAQSGVRDLALGIRAHTRVTVWRDLEGGAVSGGLYELVVMVRGHRACEAVVPEGAVYVRLTEALSCWGRAVPREVSEDFARRLERRGVLRHETEEFTIYIRRAS